ncbi:MAG TPA: hypothetical protein VN851_11635, partial [Thermoanaerobaculia bacterium]|nr:hypothetical protein [Thermoanaerobaculia bacterium]
MVAVSALLAMSLLVWSVTELNLLLESDASPGALRELWHLQIGVLLAVAFGVSATLIVVRWLTTATGGLTAAHDEIAKVTDQLQKEEATERVLEERLIEAARQWAVTFDAIDAVIVVVDEEGRMLRL